MPRFNQTGPMGQGPMTGRKMGHCTNFGANLKKQSVTETENSETNLSENMTGSDKGFGWGRGLGLGRGNGGVGRGMGRQNRFRSGN